MADFPFVPGAESMATPRPGTRIDFDGNNEPRVRAVAPEATDYRVVLPKITAAQLATIDTFYSTNRLLAFNLRWYGGATVSVKFGAGRPQRKWMVGANAYRVEFTAHGVSA